jgi:hypothetical protein
VSLVFISQHLLGNYPCADYESVDRGKDCKTGTGVQLCSYLPSTRALFNRLNKPEVQSESHGANLRSYDSRLPEQTDDVYHPRTNQGDDARSALASLNNNQGQ